ncbi:MAG: phage holin family protein [Bdellovibrionales bacterium]|nr:phage holin family protein [Bdellovibrionales bacterium]
MIQIIAHWVLAALTILATAYLVPGFTVDNFSAALVAAIVLGVLNILVWPLLALLTLPITVLTLGLFLFIVNALVIKFGAFLVPGFTIEGFLPAVIGGIVLSFIGWIVRALFTDTKTTKITYRTEKGSSDDQV